MTITETVDFMKLIRGGDSKKIIAHVDELMEEEYKTGHADGLTDAAAKETGVDR